MIKRSLAAIAVCAGLASLSAGPAWAGEATGSGANEDQNQGTSWCSFSVLNDDLTAHLDGSGPNGPGGQSQSYGQETNWVSRIRTRAIPALSATRTRHPCHRSRTELNEPSALTAFFGFGGTKISSFDPTSAAIFAAHPTHPLLALPNPPIQRAA